MNWNPKCRSKYKWVVYCHLPTNKEITMNKPITMMELEEFMSQKTGMFDANNEDIDGFCIDLLCTDVHFDKDMNDKSKYLCMILICQSGEVQFDPDAIDVILIDEDETITIIFSRAFPNLIIKYRE